MVGTFSEELETRESPVDTQELTLAVAMQCSASGPAPVELFVPDDVITSVSDSKFAQRNMWVDAKEMTVRTKNNPGGELFF